MARSIDNLLSKDPAYGYDMVAQAAGSRAHPSPASGCNPTGLSDGNTAAASPGASLGTGMNADVYTPGIEAV